MINDNLSQNILRFFQYDVALRHTLQAYKLKEF